MLTTDINPVFEYLQKEDKISVIKDF